jgi:hypothetical protein
MKGLFYGRNFFIFSFLLLLVLAAADIAIVFLCMPAGAPAAAEEPDKFEIRSGLLAEAMGFVGSCSPDGAAGVWAEGLKRRSAAMQYSVMSEQLKKIYATELEETFPNWVTGVSSPWIEKYEIIQNRIDAENYCFHIRLSTATSSGPAGDYDAVLLVGWESGFWRITEVVTEEELKVYTGFLK